MDLFDRLQEQLETVRLPLYAATVTATAQTDAPFRHLPLARPQARDAAQLPGGDMAPRAVPVSVGSTLRGEAWSQLMPWCWMRPGERTPGNGAT